MKRKTIIIALALAGVGAAAYSMFGQGGSRPMDTTQTGGVEVHHTVKQSDFELSINKKGTTKLKKEQKICFSTEGSVNSLPFGVGDKVTEGAVLAAVSPSRIDTSSQDAQRSLQEAQLRLQTFLNEFDDDVVQRGLIQEQNAEQRLTTKEREKRDLEEQHTRDQKNQEITINQAEKDLYEIQKKVKKNELLDTSSEYGLADQLNQKMNEYYAPLEKEYLYRDQYIQQTKKIIETITNLMMIGNQEIDFYRYSYGYEQMDAQRMRDDWDSLDQRFRSLVDRRDVDGLRQVATSAKSLTTTIDLAVNKLIDGLDTYITDIGESSDMLPKAQQYQQLLRQHKSTVETYSSDQYTHESTLGTFVLDQAAQKKKIAEEIVRNIQLEHESDKLKLQQAQLKLQQAQTALATMTARQQDKLLQLQRDIADAERELRLTKQRNRTKTRLATNERYRSLSNSVQQARERLAQSYKTNDNYKLIAPFDGTITAVTINKGEKLTRTSENKCITIVDPNMVYMMLAVGQSDIVSIEKDMTVRVTIDAYPDTTFTGYVQELDVVPSVQNGLAEFNIAVKIDNPEQKKIYSSMKGKATLIIKQIADAITVPVSSVMSDADGTKYVMRIADDQKQVKTPISVGVADQNVYQVLSGLKVGDVIVEMDYSNVSPAMPGMEGLEDEMGGDFMM